MHYCDFKNMSVTFAFKTVIRLFLFNMSYSGPCTLYFSFCGHAESKICCIYFFHLFCVICYMQVFAHFIFHSVAMLKVKPGELKV